MDFVTDVLAGEFGHAVVELAVRPQLVEVFGNSIGVSTLDLEAVFAVGDLEGNAAGVGGDDGFALEKVVG